MSKATRAPAVCHTEPVEGSPSLPVGWSWAKMHEVCSKVQDGTHFSPKEQSVTGDFKYITAKNIKHWGLDLSDVTYVKEQTHRDLSQRCNPEKGDVLYIKDGVTTGIATVNPLDEEFTLLSSVALLKPIRDRIEPWFLAYYLNSPDGYKRMTGQMTGTAIRRLILKKIKESVVPVAPLREQRRIVAEIEKQFTRLEAGLEALRRVQANLKRYRAGVLKAACEGKLVEADIVESLSSIAGGCVVWMCYDRETLKTTVYHLLGGRGDALMRDLQQFPQATKNKKSGRVPRPGYRSVKIKDADYHHLSLEKLVGILFDLT